MDNSASFEDGGPQCRICFDVGSDGEQGPLSLCRCNPVPTLTLTR